MSEREILGLLGLLSDKLDAVLESSIRSPKRFFTVTNAAGYSDLSEESIRRLLSSRKLTAYRPVRGRVLVDRQELDALIRSSTTSPRNGRGRTNRQ